MKKIKRTIFTKIWVSLIFASFIIGVFISVFSIRERNQDIKESLIREAKMFAQIMAKNIESGYLIQILPEKPLREISAFKDILFFWIVRPNGEIYLADDSKMVGKVIKDPFLATKEVVIKDSIYQEDGQKIKLFIYPLEIKSGEQPWSLFMGVSLKRIAAVQKEAILFDLSFFLLVAIFSTFISFYFAKKITNPLKHLEKGIKIIGKGNLDYRIKLKTGDEIEDLGNAFNKMAEDLGRSRISLEEAKTVLEIKVGARTRELRELIEQREEIIKERTKELQERVNELEKFHRLTVGRELKMVELKRKIKELELKLKEKDLVQEDKKT